MQRTADDRTLRPMRLLRATLVFPSLLPSLLPPLFALVSALVLALFLALLAAVAPPANAQALCESPSQTCGALLSSECLGRLGAGSTPALQTGGCGDQLERYRECLASVAQLCGDDAGQASGADAPDPATMLTIWNEIKDSGDPDALEAFAENFPNSSLASLAANRAASLREADAAVDRERQAEAIYEALRDVDDAQALEIFAANHEGTEAAERALRRAAAIRAAAAPQPAAPEPAAPETRPQPTPAPIAPPEPDRGPLFRAAQTELNRLGYDVGAPDGVWGPRSSAALAAFSRDTGRALDNPPSDGVLALLRSEPTPAAAPAPAPTPAIAADGAPPDVYQAEIDWEVAKGWQSESGVCSVTLRHVGDGRYVEKGADCQGERIDYDLSIAPDGGAIQGTLQFFGFEASTGRISVSGANNAATGSRANTSFSMRITPAS